MSQRLKLGLAIAGALLALLLVASTLAELLLPSEAKRESQKQVDEIQRRLDELNEAKEADQ